MRETMHWSRIFMICAALLAAFFFLRARIDEHTEALNRKTLEMRVELNDVQKRNAEIVDEMNVIGSDGYIERRAREELGFIMPGDLVFEFTNEEALSEYTDEQRAILEAERNGQQ